MQMYFKKPRTEKKKNSSPLFRSNLERDLHDCKSRAEEATVGRDAAQKKQRESEAGLERVQKEKVAIDSVLQTLKADMVKVRWSLDRGLTLIFNGFFVFFFKGTRTENCKIG